MRSRTFNGWLLAANLGLVVFALILFSTRSRPPATEADPATAEATEPAPAAEPQKVVVTNQFQWAQLESEDYPTYIKRLRAIGCPEQTIRDIIIADLDKLLAPKVQGIYGRRPEVHYWDCEEEELANNYDHREWQRQEREIDREKRRLIQELVGVDLVRERLKLKGYEDYYERRLAFLPEDKRDSVRQILDKYDEQERDLKDHDPSDPLSPQDKAQLRNLTEERRAELAKLLSPEEQQQFELWLSPSANTVRYGLYGMNATEEEFQAVYPLQRAFDDKWGDPEDVSTQDSATLLAWQQEREQLQAQVRDRLGGQRFAEYQRGADPDFHALNATVSRFNLPRETAAEAYEVKRTVQQMTASLQARPQIHAEARQQAVQDMAKETEFKLRQLLSNSGFRYYQQHGSTDWVKY
jgi:hypothetical protein